MRNQRSLDELWETFDVNKRGFPSPADLKQGLQKIDHRIVPFL